MKSAWKQKKKVVLVHTSCMEARLSPHVCRYRGVQRVGAQDAGGRVCRMKLLARLGKDGERGWGLLGRILQTGEGGRPVCTHLPQAWEGRVPARPLSGQRGRQVAFQGPGPLTPEPPAQEVALASGLCPHARSACPQSARVLNRP